MSNLTGNKIVDEISALHINSIPETWYHTIKRNNQPHAMAILVLWDLIYWYKWTEIRDESSGFVIGYKKKFKADLLQRSYEAISNKFGISKRQATDIIVFLEKLGAVKRVFRNIKIANTTLSNVLFIELVPSVIKELCNVDSGEVSRFDGGGSHVDAGEGLTDSGETYTTTSTTNTTTNSTNSSEVTTTEPTSTPFPEIDNYSENENNNKSANADTVKKSKRTFAYSKYTNHHFQIYKGLVDKHLITDKPVDYNYGLIAKRIKTLLTNPYFTEEKILQGITNGQNDASCLANNYSLEQMLTEANMTRLIDERYIRNNQSFQLQNKHKCSAASSEYGKQNWDIKF